MACNQKPQPVGTIYRLEPPLPGMHVYTYSAGERVEIGLAALDAMLASGAVKHEADIAIPGCFSEGCRPFIPRTASVYHAA